MPSSGRAPRLPSGKTRKQEKLVAAIKKNPLITLKEAAKQAGYVSDASAYHATQDPAVQSDLRKVYARLNEIGAGDELYCQNIKKGMNSRFDDERRHMTIYYGKLRRFVTDDPIDDKDKPPVLIQMNGGTIVV